jgi:hypothetical protein
MVMEVITGGGSVLDWTSVPGRPSQEIFIPGRKRSKKTNKKGEIFIFFANISEAKRVKYPFSKQIAINKQYGIALYFRKQFSN